MSKQTQILEEIREENQINIPKVVQTYQPQMDFLIKSNSCFIDQVRLSKGKDTLLSDRLCPAKEINLRYSIWHGLEIFFFLFKNKNNGDFCGVIKGLSKST